VSVATALAALEAHRDNLAAALEALDVYGPDISVDGVTISATAYARQLREEIVETQKQIDSFGGPCVAYTQGR